MTMETEESKHILIFHGKKNNKKVHKRRRARRARKILLMSGCGLE